MNKGTFKKPFYLIAKYWLGKFDGFIKIGDNEEEITELFKNKYMSSPEHDFGVTEASYSLLKLSASELLDSEDEQSPYCEVCGTCGYIECCGIDSFIENHIKGKTNCKNEEFIIEDLRWLNKNNKELRQENKQLKDNWNELKVWIKSNDEHYSGAIPFKQTLRKMQELERGEKYD